MAELRGMFNGRAELSAAIAARGSFLCVGLDPDQQRIPASCGSRSLFLRLQGEQAVTTLFQVEAPPRDRGTTWSSVRRARLPQYWQACRSRAKSARRVIRREVKRGTRTYATSRITTGCGNVVEGERISRVGSASSTSALRDRIRLQARHTLVTLSGSYVAFRTSTEPAMRRGYSTSSRRFTESPPPPRSPPPFGAGSAQGVLNGALLLGRQLE